MKEWDEFHGCLPEPYKFRRAPEFDRANILVAQGLLKPSDVQNVMNHFQMAYATDRETNDQEGVAVDQNAIMMTAEKNDDYHRSISLLLMALTDAAGGPDSGVVPCGHRMVQHAEGGGRRPAIEEEGDRAYGLPTDGSHARTWELFLNGHEVGETWEWSPFEGGEIYFPSRHTFIEPTPGTLVVWWPGLPFGVAPVRSGVRRSVRGWCSYNSARDIRLRMEHVLTSSELAEDADDDLEWEVGEANIEEI